MSSFQELLKTKRFAKTPVDGSSKYHLLEYHSLDVAATFSILLNSTSFKKILSMFFEDIEQGKSFLTFLASLHDTGKLSKSSFQVKLDPFYRRGSLKKPHHTITGAYSMIIVINALNEIKLLNKDSFELFLLIFTTFSYHHGSAPASSDLSEFVNNLLSGKKINVNLLIIKSELTPDEFTDFLIPFTKQMLNSIPNAKKSLIELKTKPFTQENINLLQNFIAGFMIEADWIASDAKFFPYEDELLDLNRYFKRSLLQAEYSIDQKGIENIHSTYQNSFQELLGDHFTSLTPLQSFMSEYSSDSVEPKLFIIEDATGAGKTEASFLIVNNLSKSLNLKGSAFALPTKTTTDSFFFRVKDIFAKMYNDSAHLTLSHSSSKDTLDTTSEKLCDSWYNEFGKEILSTSPVGTIDQFLKAVLHTKKRFLTLSSLANRIIIFDEIHSADSYMSGLLQNLIEALSALGSTVVLMSATLTKKQKEEMVHSFNKGLSIGGFKSSKDIFLEDNPGYPLVSLLDNGHFLEQQIKSRDESVSEKKFKIISSRALIYNFIEKTVNNDSNICWIRNTVADVLIAKEELLKNGFNEDDIFILHSRFLPEDRKIHTEKILTHFDKNSTHKDRRHKIVIATQVIEQSLDLDFDEMITDLTYADYLIQRIGRRRRHTRNEKGDRSTQESREDSPIIIYSPEYTKTPRADWYSSFFRGAAYVYKNHYNLYKTLEWLINNNLELSLPEQIRDFIEFSFTEATENIEDRTESLSNAVAREELEQLSTKEIAKAYSYKITDPFISKDNLKNSRLITNSVQIFVVEELSKEIYAWKGNTMSKSILSVPASSINYSVPEEDMSFTLKPFENSEFKTSQTIYPFEVVYVYKKINDKEARLIPLHEVSCKKLKYSIDLGLIK